MNFRNFILYGLSVGLNRGIVFFLLPLAGYFLNKNDFGTFSLIIITSQLLIPILTINVSSVIAREFLDAKEMLNRYVGYIVILLIGMTILSMLFGGKYKNVFCFIISESLLMVLITRARFFLGVNTYFVATVLKAISFLLIFLIVFLLRHGFLYNVNSFCIMLALSNYVAILFVLSKDFFINISYKVSLSNLHFFLQKDKKFIWFGILLIPHSLSQWVMSSSDRYIIKVFFNDTVLGEYSLAYAYASLFMLFISVLAITLPEYCIRKYDSFCKKRMLLMFMATMALVYIFGFISLYVVVLQYINFNVREINIFCIIYSSLFYLVMYHYCSSFHFYHKRSKFITKTTLLASLFSVLITLIFAWKGNIIGVSFCTYFSYFFYFLLIRRGVSTINTNVEISVMMISFIPLLIRCFHVIS